MADAEKTENGYDVTWQVIGFIIFIFILGTVLARHGIGSGTFDFIAPPSDGDIATEQRGLTFPSGDISLGERIINKYEIDVHRTPAGRILGQQPKREVGKVLEGPVEAKDVNWWRIDYKNAPDGWVDQNGITSKVWLYRLLNIFPIIFGTITPFMILFSIIIFILIIIVLFKMKSLDKFKQKKLDYARGKNVKQEIIESSLKEKEEERDTNVDEKDILVANLPTGENVPKTKDVHNKRWAKVETLINSHNVNDWKQAIIEADIILDEMLEKMGYKGDTIAEKLKQVEESDFLTLNQAWEAHKIRNKIAHDGSDYVLGKNTADKTIQSFREVFEEFYFI